MRHRSSVFAALLAACAAPTALAAEARDDPHPTYDPKTHTYVLEERPTERAPAPPSPMAYGDALLHWDGTGELLLRAPADVREGQTFGMGATFADGDAAGTGAGRRCPRETLWYRLSGGHLRLSLGVSDRGDRIGSGGPPRGAPSVTFTMPRCRYRLSLATDIRDGAGWATAPETPLPPPEPVVPIGPAIRLKAGDTFVIKGGPLPQELVPLPLSLGMGSRVGEALAAACPRSSGMVTLEERGVYFEQPWLPEHDVVAGLRRDERARATTLIFQTDACREEITVTREVWQNGAWTPSPLSTDPKGPPD